MSTRIHVVVPDGLLGLIDADRGDVARSRWMVRAAEAFLAPAIEKLEVQGMKNILDQPSPYLEAKRAVQARKTVESPFPAKHRERPAFSAQDAALERQARLNRSKGL
jgi:hypothetical protein